MTEASRSSAQPVVVGRGRVFWPLLGCLAVAGAAAAATGAWRGRELLRDERTHAARDTRGAADAIALAVNGRMALVGGLRAFVEHDWNEPGLTRRFDDYVQRLLGGTSGVWAAQFLVNDTLLHVYPLAPDEPRRGFEVRQRSDSATTPPLTLTAGAREDIVLSGPHRLVHGGQGLTGLVGARDREGRRLTVVALVVELPPLLGPYLDSASGMIRSLRDDRGQQIAGPDSVFRVPRVEVPFKLLDRSWVLAEIPAAGWLASAREQIHRARAEAFVIVLLLGGVVWATLGRREALRRMQQEAARRTAEERFSRLFQMSPDGVVVTQVKDGSILAVNDSFVELSGWSREELIGRTTLELGMWLSVADRDRLINLVRTQGECVGEIVRVRNRSGVELEVEFSARIVPGEGEPLLLSLTRDITERRLLERKLAQAQRMEAIGRLAGGVAHDFNNILTAIIAAADATRMALPAGHPGAEESAEILRASARAADLTRQLLTFARRSSGTPGRIDVNAVVEDARRFLARLIGEDIRLTVSLEPGLPPVQIDPTQLHQVLLNLAVNARDAMPRGGELSIKTHQAPQGIRIEVRDTGEGIPPEHQPFIFEPFFTTKESGKGTGLGLATAYGILQQAGGSIDVESRPGAGACFCVFLPGAGSSPGSAPAVAEPEVEMPRARPGETILLAEDDPQVRLLSRRTLESLGYTPLPAADGADALRIAQFRETPVDLLVTDVVMPVMSGVDLARALTERWPNLRVLFVSGYPEDYAALACALESGALFLPKPFTPVQLAAAVRRALDAGPVSGTA